MFAICFWFAFIADETNTDYVQLFADREPLQTVHVIYLVYIQSIWYAGMLRLKQTSFR